ncbi:hypothetical protein [Methylobacterium planeticum]|uniref:Phage holin family protein n=1 Tax=Methylobacterium planeticum TaxID=2615211 RepID=A0A6N6MCC3_9HYPH|nr:hypothetical protein [Methylobacterium planeticum]KAB1068276.1 hypothetical protein F6X51_27005 [Methylobacterium planeticum]
MLLLVFTAIGGGIATAGLMWSQGALLSLLSAPIGASLATLAVACLLATRRSAEWRSEPDLDRQSDEMVAVLRGIAARGLDRKSDADAPDRKVA